VSDSLPVALLNRVGVHQRLSGAGLATLATTFDEMNETESESVDAGDPISRIPTLWSALAETVGLTVDIDGRIIDGPRSSVPGLEPLVMPMQRQGAQ
jgi:hypothetical protein